MGRLLPGENDKIDNINNLVEMALGEDAELSKEALGGLLSLFHPLILKLCNKWSEYFNDHNHKLIPWDNLVADAQYWFIKYTKEKYIIDGSATYNKFIKDHLDQRIRYIYETELKYIKRLIFPDPSKSSESGYGNETPPLESVIYNYCTNPDRDLDMDDAIIDDEEHQSRKDLVTVILSKLNDTRYFTQREAKIFVECALNGKTHEEIGRSMGISRTRVSQIMGRTREKLRDIAMNRQEWWDVY